MILRNYKFLPACGRQAKVRNWIFSYFRTDSYFVEQGMSLIEVIISMFLLSVLLVFYVSALNVVATTRKLKYENLAYHVANKQMEELRLTPFSFLPPSGNISDPLLSQIPLGSGNFTVTNDNNFTGLKDITVTVNWNDGVAKQVQFLTRAGSGGINP